MIIESLSATVVLPHEQLGNGALKDVQNLYGGAIARVRNEADGEPEQRLQSAVAGIRAHAAGREPTETLVSFPNLADPQIAARWTALQAYKARGGVAFDFLTTEVPDLRAHQEWSGRSKQERNKDTQAREAANRTREEELVNDTTISDEEYVRRLDALYDEIERESREEAEQGRDLGGFYTSTSAGSGNDPIQRLIQGMIDYTVRDINTVGAAEEAIAAGDEVGLEMALRESAGIQRAASAFMDAPLTELPHTHTLFFAHGPSLPAAAHVLADNYGQLTYRDADEDPNATVARALGVPSLDRLDQVWALAMTQRTPRAAGRTALEAFVR